MEIKADTCAYKSAHMYAMGRLCLMVRPLLMTAFCTARGPVRPGCPCTTAVEDIGAATSCAVVSAHATATTMLGCSAHASWSTYAHFSVLFSRSVMRFRSALPPTTLPHQRTGTNWTRRHLEDCDRYTSG